MPVLPKILVIRFSSIGDIVLTTPVVRCIKKQLPGAEVHYLTKKEFVPLLLENPYIDKVISIDKNVAEILDELRNGHYDFVVDLHHNLRSFQVKRGLKTASSSFPKLNIEKWLLVNLKVNRLPGIHIVDRYFQTVKKLNVANDGIGLDYFIPVADEVDTGLLPLTHRQGYIGFVIGARHYTKQLPETKIISICRKISSPIILLGGKADFEKGEAVSKALGSRVYNACGKYNIGQSASLVRQANKIITHDTGLMHIAAAFKKDIISVWGNTIPAFGMYPYMPGAHSQIVEVEGLSCRPCSKIGYKACPKKHFKCMMLIDEEKIAAHAG